VNSGSYAKCSNKYTESSESVSDASMSCLAQKGRQTGSQTLGVIQSPSFGSRPRADGPSGVQMQTYREVVHAHSALARTTPIGGTPDKAEGISSAPETEEKTSNELQNCRSVTIENLDP